MCEFCVSDQVLYLNFCHLKDTLSIKCGFKPTVLLYFWFGLTRMLSM